MRVPFQGHRQRSPKVYALHAPEVEYIGKGIARAAYEFGWKVSVATPAIKPRGGQFVLHATALHGNPYCLAKSASYQLGIGPDACANVTKPSSGHPTG